MRDTYPQYRVVLSRQARCIGSRQLQSHPKFNSQTVPVLPSLDPSLKLTFYHLPSTIHITGFSFCFFPDFLAIFLSCCHLRVCSNFHHGPRGFRGCPQLGTHNCRETPASQTAVHQIVCCFPSLARI